MSELNKAFALISKQIDAAKTFEDDEAVREWRGVIDLLGELQLHRDVAAGKRRPVIPSDDASPRNWDILDFESARRCIKELIELTSGEGADWIESKLEDLVNIENCLAYLEDLAALIVSMESQASLTAFGVHAMSKRLYEKVDTRLDQLSKQIADQRELGRLEA
ncbi:conserved hypothetical protein [Roseibium sp. TrichSKD4]|uniref:hypothetical protein n=1 Tax=Roseibium sp. TrichSKD4 TaxID=744980 RepID=UPI0001E5692F|nr:hypothetical protein [Roseibium sp. TrichSKD4]EFO32463.1 conserved hypothetical protein [Roseibium sp. TrichSKD4]